MHSSPADSEPPSSTAHGARPEPGADPEAESEPPTPGRRVDDVASPGAPNHTGEVDLLDPHDLLADVPRAWLADRAADVLAHLALAGELRVRLVNDAAMADAHERFAGVPGTTDVLTMDLADGASAEGAPLDVDLLLCVDEAARQARERRHPVERELLLYLVHGLLHCLGHNDHDDAAFATMHAREDEILRAIGVGDTYQTRHNAGATS